jgi:beta-glucosidase
MKRYFTLFMTLTLTLLAPFALAQNQTSLLQHEARVDALLATMTLEEKIGQLNFVGHGANITGPEGAAIDFEAALKQGMIGGVQNIRGVDLLTKLQKMTVDGSRLGIPLLFPADIIHGTEVVFPIPLAQASSWDLESIERAERIAAIEATAQGINMNYAPMVDISRDPRWGRVLEGAGEDTFLGAKIAATRVRAYQGNDLSDPLTLVACVKHFAAYGASESGRDYNIVDMSERRLRETYLPPYQAAIDAGAGSVMVSFNELNGVPSSSNRYLLQDILRSEWGFNGFVIGDYTSVAELIEHGVANDLKHAAELSMNAGLDADLVSLAFLKHTKELVAEGKVNVKTVDEAVRRVLRIKFALGIMDNPYHYLDKKREQEYVYKKEYLDAARDLSKKSIVLLKNEGRLLPLKKNIRKLALIGPFVDNNKDPKGAWAFGGAHYGDIVSLLDGVENKLAQGTQILYAKGSNTDNDSLEHIKAAIKIAKKADVVVVAVGEPFDITGEAASRTQLTLPGAQMTLLEELRKVGKPMVVLVFSGRPLVLEWLDKNVPALMQVWHLGHESGNAIADVIFGDYNPSGKLTMSFPYSVGQIPIYYNNKTTGRPFSPDCKWCTRYLDNPNTPLYPFGFGLSYTEFEYSELTLDKPTITTQDTLTASVTLTNTGEYDGMEIVQLYVRDVKGSVARPVKELKGFQNVYLKKGQKTRVSFSISVADLSFYDIEMKYAAEPGEFKVIIGTNSAEYQEASFLLK